MKKIRNLFRILGGLALLVLVILGSARVWAVISTAGSIKTEPPENEIFEVAVVLGCSVLSDGSPSLMLQSRLDEAAEIYRTGAVEKILVTGDHRDGEYDEVDCMTEYLIEQGIPETDIMQDYRGFSTYESMYRASQVFCVRHAIVVTQRYHLYRALFIGKFWGMELTGVAAESRPFSAKSILRELREWPACLKDVIYCLTGHVAE